MSRPQATQQHQPAALAEQTRDVPAGEWLSALVDGECPQGQWPALVGERPAGAELHEDWAHFHLIGDALRSGTAATRPASPAFAAAVMARLAAEQAAPVQSVVPVQAVPVAVVTAPSSANDAVFRWKMLAGVASLAAVVAVAWQLTVAPSGGLPGSLSGPQLASTTPADPQAVPVAVGRDIVVSTGAGVLVRDPELEAFIAAHRQSGGMSALQMPAGFLRNATFEAPQR